MKNQAQIKMAILAFTAMALVTPVAAQSTPGPTATGKTVALNPDSSTTSHQPVATTREIVVSLEDRKLALIENGKVLKVYPVAVGKPSTPSPIGTFTIERRVMNPTYSHDGHTVLPGPNNPVGTRWMGLSVHGYGIHGTNEPHSIGKAASHGCIRLAKSDLEELYPMVEVGDTVELIGHRDEETALLFGEPQVENEIKSVSVASSVPDAKADAAAAAHRQALNAAGATAQSATQFSGADALVHDHVTAVAGLTLFGTL
jgi:lipoprotein-anchoring transpeptidase ErfK/SrfK